MKLLTLSLICLSIPLAVLAGPIECVEPARQILFFTHPDEEEMILADSMYAMLVEVGREVGFATEYIDDPVFFDRIETLRAFDLIVSTDQAMKRGLSVEQRRIFEIYILGDGGHSGGKFLCLTQEAQVELSRSEQSIASTQWIWFEELIRLGFGQEWEEPDEWEEANLPYLRVQGMGKEASARIRSASSTKYLPHPEPGDQLKGGQIFSTIIGASMRDYQRNHNGKRENPILEEHLTEATQWMLDLQSVPPQSIKLLDFSAVPTLDKVALSWKTVWEEGNDYFEIQRASNKTEWKALDLVKSVGNSPQPCRYEYWDVNVQTGTYFYRIRQSDMEKQENYSDIVMVQIGLKQPLLSLFPNPVRQTLHVSVILEEMSDFALQIEDREGRMIQRRSVEAIMASHPSKMDLSHLTPGVYQLRLITPEEEFIKTFIKY